MSKHLLDGVPHDDGRGGEPLLARQFHAAEPTAHRADMNSRSGGRVPAGVSGAAGRGIVGAAVPAGRLSPLVRAAAVGYLIAGVTIGIVAFSLAPWGLLLLVFAFAAVLVAFFLHLMAEGLATIEEDDLRERATASELAESETPGRGDRR